MQKRYTASGRLFRRSAPAERHHLLECAEELRLDADLDLAAGDVDRGLLRLDRLRQAGVDQAEGDAIDIDLVASPLLASVRVKPISEAFAAE